MSIRKKSWLLAMSTLFFFLGACSNSDELNVVCSQNKEHLKSMGWSLTCRSTDPHPSYIVGSCYKDRECDVYQGMIAQALGAERSSLNNNLEVVRKFSDGNGWFGKEPYGLGMRGKTCGAILTVPEKGESPNSETITNFGCYDDINENSVPNHLE